jgi:hypothetical protein
LAWQHPQPPPSKASIEDAANDVQCPKRVIRDRVCPHGVRRRRNIERAVFEMRTEMARVAQRKAEEAGEPDDLPNGAEASL